MYREIRPLMFRFLIFSLESLPEGLFEVPEDSQLQKNDPILPEQTFASHECSRVPITSLSANNFV